MGSSEMEDDRTEIVKKNQSIKLQWLICISTINQTSTEAVGICTKVDKYDLVDIKSTACKLNARFTAV